MNKIKSGIRVLTFWVKNHPFQAMAYSSFFTLLATCIAFREDLWWLKAAVGAFLVPFSYSVWRYSKATVSALLIASFLTMSLTPRKAEAVGVVPIGVGIVVIVVGVVVIVKFVRFCNKHFPRDGGANTNALPPLGFAAPVTYSGSMVFDTQNCPPPDDFALYPPVTTYITGIVGSNSMTVSTVPGLTTNCYQNLKRFSEEVVSYGLSVQPGVLSQSYAIDGVPCSAIQTPISFDAPSRTVTVAGGAQRVVIEESSNLRDWRPVATVNVPVGTRLQVEDTTQSDGHFYRMQLVP